MSLKTVRILIISILVVQFHSPAVHSANILFYFGISGPSHVSTAWPIILELGERGHNVTLLTSFLPHNTHPNVTVVYAIDLYNSMFKDRFDEGGDLVAERFAGTHLGLWSNGIHMSLHACNLLFDSPSAQSLIHNSKFDLVIVDTAFNDCAFGLAYYKYKCPYILYSAISIFTSYFDDFGLQVESSIIPDMEIGNSAPLSFWDRLIATWQPIRWMYKRRVELFPKLSQLFQEQLYLNNTPNFQEVYAKTSLVLLNTHFSNDFARSLPPLFVSVAGIGIKHERKPIPSDLERFLTKPGTKGFIYVSFGTVVRISRSNHALRQKFFSTFGNMSDYQFVWKWEDNIPNATEAPSNIYFAKWLPQQDLFAHSSIRGFVAHGGRNGANEAVYYGVPVIFFPIMGDQDYNANTLAAKDMAIVLEITDFTEMELTGALNRILHDKDIRSRATHASTIFRDRPMKPLDTAIWWIEYVLRHKDTSFLMPLSVHQPWYQRRLLDVWFFVFTVFTVGILALSVLIVKLFIFLCKRFSASPNKLKLN